MTAVSREARINEAFVKVADTLMDSYDVVDLLATLIVQCTELLDYESGGLLISSPGGQLELIASTSEDAEFVEVMQLAAGVGPCVDCFTSGKAVAVEDIAKDADKWPLFKATALARGFRSLHATPMRLRGEVIGTMNLLGAHVGKLDARDTALAQALADVSIIGILQERIFRDSSIITEQLQLALDTRILIEQAKGVLAYTRSMSMDQAFATLRDYARAQKSSLRAVAEGVVKRTIEIPAK